MADQRHGGTVVEPVVFIVNGDEPTRAWIERTVASAGLHAIGLSTASGLAARLAPGAVACAILDVRLQDASCFELQGWPGKAPPSCSSRGSAAFLPVCGH